MNRQPVSYYFRNPGKLVDLSIEQIENWLKESPYSQPLRVLLAKKLFFDQEQVLNPAVTIAANHVSDRTWLYHELYPKSELRFRESDSDLNIEETVTSIETAAGVLAVGHIPESAEVLNEDEVDFVDELKDVDNLNSAEIVEEVTHSDNIQVTDDDDDDDDDDDKMELPDQIVEDETQVEEDYIVAKENETLEAIDNQVEFEDVILQVSSEDDIEMVSDEIILDLGEESIDDDIVSEISKPLDIATEKKVVEIESVVDSIESNESLIEPIVATLDRSESGPKLIILNDSIEEVQEDKTLIDSQSDISVMSEDIISGNQKEKKKKGKKKKKVKKSDKKSKRDKKDKKKKKKFKKANKKKSNKKGRDKNKVDKKTDRNKAMAEFWDSKIEKISTPTKKSKKAKSNSNKSKKKKIQLSKYEVSISPIEEEAYHYYADSGKMSEYTKWLMNLGKNKGDNSYKHMATYTDKTKSTSTVEEGMDAKTKSKKSKSKYKKKSKGKLKKKEDYSLETNEEIISELWAELLAKQGHIKKASKMYLKLSLKYPEKSSYFAAKLENLKKNK